MMNLLPRNTILGELSLGETFVSYDGPKLFTATSTSEQIYLVLAIEEAETEDQWLYLPLSSARLAMVRSGGVKLYEAFKRAEGMVFKVSIPHGAADRATADPISPKSLDAESLPFEGIGLNLPTFTLSKAESDSQIERRAQQEIRTRLRIEVELEGITRTEAPTRKIAELLLATQDVYDNFGLTFLDRTLGPRQHIPLDVVQEMQSELVGLSAASFMIELASTKSDYVFGKSAFAHVTEALLKLLDPALSKDSLIEELKTLQIRSAKSFRNFVDGLVKTDADISLIGAGVAFSVVRRDLPIQKLQTLKKILHTLIPDKKFQIKGRMRLNSANVDKRSFGFHDQTADIYYTGSVSDTAFFVFSSAKLDGLYDVVIAMETAFDQSMGEMLPEYELIQMIEAAGKALATKTVEITE